MEKLSTLNAFIRSNMVLTSYSFQNTKSLQGTLKLRGSMVYRLLNILTVLMNVMTQSDIGELLLPMEDQLEYDSFKTSFNIYCIQKQQFFFSSGVLYI